MAQSNLERIIALDLRSHGLGFAVLEPGNLVDWGLKNLRGGVNAPRIPLSSKVGELIATYVPDAFVLKVPRTHDHKILDELKAAAAREQIPVRCISPRSVRSVFPGCRNKDQIASAVCDRFLELLPVLPPQRKIWTSEDDRMGIFEAMATGVAYFEGQKETTQPIPQV